MQLTTPTPATFASDIAFTPTVKAIQARKGSRHAYQRVEQGGSWESRITPDLRAFIEAQTSVFLATVNAEGQPYIQHRGGPVGFLQVLDDQRIGFVDFSGNRQFISSGNLAENPKAHLFLIDYAKRRRVKLWGEAQVIENDALLCTRLMPKGYKAKAEQVMLFTVKAWDENCSQHIPQRFEAVDVACELADRDARIQALEAQVQDLRAAAR